MFTASHHKVVHAWMNVISSGYPVPNLFLYLELVAVATVGVRVCDERILKWCLRNVYHTFCIHSSVDGHVDCFHVLATVKRATMNTGIHVSLSIMAFSGYVPSSGISGWYDSSIPWKVYIWKILGFPITCKALKSVHHDCVTQITWNTIKELLKRGLLWILLVK